MKATSNSDRHRFGKCVAESRSLIKGKDQTSLASISLLSELIYEYENIDNINFSNISWQVILDKHSDWKNHYEVTEYWFGTILEFLTDKISI